MNFFNKNRVIQVVDKEKLKLFVYEKQDKKLEKKTEKSAKS